MTGRQKCWGLRLSGKAQDAAPDADIRVEGQQSRGARSVVGVEGHVVELQRLHGAILTAHLLGIHVQRNVVDQLLHVRQAAS